eukprot:GCRY01000293.1.p1 GENE.GCRY01000293.1~~GCRY01000293.1.p1  ORF type:complete len:527 (-),score=80.37 GCRY01000293.1:292-1872(-)
MTGFVPEWASVNPFTVSGEKPHTILNLLEGKWVPAQSTTDIIDPMNGEVFMKMANTQVKELEPFVSSLKKCPKSGLHNPYKNPERYVLWGEVTTKMVTEIRKPEVIEFFIKLIQRVCPKHEGQARGEIKVTTKFLENFCGDQVRFLARGFSVSGDHLGQTSKGLRYPFGPVCLVAPFNFPLEIPVLQLMGALYMGNKVTLKAASIVCVVMEQFIRMMHYCGAPLTDVDFLCCGGRVMGEFIKAADPRTTQFTGSSVVAEELSTVTHGKIRIEDAGFDWKVLGPDVGDIEYVAWQCDQDAYALSGQKCSAQSIMFMHTNWSKTDLLKKIEAIAAERTLDNLSVGPVLSHTTEEIIGHANKLASLPGGKILFGAKELQNHTIPKKYGAVHPTAVFVPLDEILRPENFALATTEIFGPFQLVTEFDDDSVDKVLECLERLSAHLTAAVVSNDPYFIQKIAGSTVNGTTYIGRRARTTGAPQNHWFGPSNDPRCAGIGTIEAIRLVWSSHREVIEDFGPVTRGWKRPRPS